MDSEKKKGGMSLVTGSFSLCILFLVIFFSELVYYLNVAMNQGVSTELSDKYAKIFIWPIILGVLFFGIGLIAITYKVRKKNINEKGIFFACVKIIFFLLILPFFLLWSILQPVELFKKISSLGVRQYRRGFKFKPFFFKLAVFCLVLGTILPLWLGGFWSVKNNLNFTEDQIRISGTGSMYPTFPKGQEKEPKEQAKEIVETPGMMRYPSGFGLFVKNFLSYSIGRGDIVLFSNDQTKKITERQYGEASGFIKRVVALPGDVVEIRDGIFYLNGVAQKEPYVAQARSTFGGQFLEECKPVTIPNDNLFVMGDNRRGSGDSRDELGLIRYGDIDHVIPFEKQSGVLDKNWHDPSNDLEESHKIIFDVTNYVKLLNKKRLDAGLMPLKYQQKLEESAKLRGKIILKYNDFSFNAVKSGYTIEEAMRDVGYLNTTYSELLMQGYYEAEELIENQFENLEDKKFLLDKEYQEIGVAVVGGNINGCPSQVIIQHLASYTPPNYKKSDIESWEQVLWGLKEIQPSWINAKNGDKDDLKRINEIFAQRILNLQKIIDRMNINQWLTVEEIKMMEIDESLGRELNNLTNKVNKGL